MGRAGRQIRTARIDKNRHGQRDLRARHEIVQHDSRGNVAVLPEVTFAIAEDEQVAAPLKEL
jgi:hypothetical protein